MWTKALNFNAALGTAWHIRQIQITVTVVEVTNLPFRIQRLEIADSRKPNRAQEFYGPVPQTLIKKLQPY